MKTREELIKIAIENIIFVKAHDAMGIYPRSVSGGDNPYKERNDYQNGWNDALLKTSDKACKFEEFLAGLSDVDRNALENLLIEDIVDLSLGENSVEPWINVNDVFYYAADAEELEVKDLVGLNSIYEKYGWNGVVAWVAVRRGIEPRPDKNYKNSENYIKAFDELQ